MLNRYFDSVSIAKIDNVTRREEPANGDSMTMDDLPVDIDHDAAVEIMDRLRLQLDRLQQQHVKLYQEYLKCQEGMLMNKARMARLIECSLNADAAAYQMFAAWRQSDRA